MVLALVTLFLPGSTKPLKVLSSIGFIVSSLGRFWHHGLMYTFGWDYWDPGRMKIGIAWWVLPWIMPALLMVCFAEKLDTTQP